jgi:hypothetical protein
MVKYGFKKMPESNRLNALKTIYSRLTTMDKSEAILADVGISMRDLNKVTKDAPVILDELATKWNGLTKEQQQNTAVGLAGKKSAP